MPDLPGKYSSSGCLRQNHFEASAALSFNPGGGRSRIASSIASAVTLLVLFPIAVLTRGRRLLLAIIILNVPLRIGAHLFYRQEWAELGAQAGLDLSVSTLALAVLYGIWVIQFAVDRSSRVPRPHYSLPLGIYCLFAAISFIAARDRTLAAFELTSMVQAFLTYVYIATWVRTRSDILFVVRLLLIGVVLESLFAVALTITGQEIRFAGLKGTVETDQKDVAYFPRTGGTVGSANGAAGYLVMCTLPAMSIMLLGRGAQLKWVALAAFVAGGVALVLTFSRGGWLGFLLATIILIFGGSHYIKISPQIFTGVLVLAVLGIVVFRSAISGRLFEGDRGAAYARLPLMRLAVRMISDNPVLGVGVNNFPVRMEKYATRDLSGEWLYSVHNKYLLDWTEMGLGGLLALLWFLQSTVRAGWRSWKMADPSLAPLALAFTAALSGVMVHMLFDVYRDPQYLWVGTAVIAAIWNETRRQVFAMQPSMSRQRRRSQGVALA